LEVNAFIQPTGPNFCSKLSCTTCSFG